MTFDLFAMQAQLLGRLVEAGISAPLLGTFDPVDLTDDGAQVTAAQLLFIGFDPVGQIGRSTAHHAAWSFEVSVDTQRATDAQKQAAMQVFSDAMAALVGWETAPGGRAVQLGEGRKSGFDGRVVGISFGFTVPVYLAGT